MKLLTITLLSLFIVAWNAPLGHPVREAARAVLTDECTGATPFSPAYYAKCE